MTGDVTAAVNLHTEGYLAIPSLRSARAAVNRARQHGGEAHLLVVVDSGDDLTRSLARDWVAADEAILEVEHKNLALARNAATEHSVTEWIAFLDGDDLWCTDWLASALRAAAADPREIVWHPEISIYFGGRNEILRHNDMDDPEFDVFALADANLWTSLCFARRNLIRAVPYPRINLGKGAGYEDWSWNRDIIRQAAIHKIVPGTAHAIRSRPGSLGSRSLQVGAIPTPTLLFREAFEALVRSRRYETTAIETSDATQHPFEA